MKAGEEHFLRFLEGHDKQFVIPVYQRNYDWKKEQCQQLFADILDIIKQDQKSYFIGSIVSIYDEDSSKNGEFVIIDGQQRITTLSILLLAIYNLLESEEIESSSPTLKEQIKDTYLVNKYSEDEKRIRLKPIKDDNKAFLKLFKNTPEAYVHSSNITVNYLYLSEKITDADNHGITVDQIYDAVKKLMIVDIRLKRGEDNPQLIFESLNSTGKKLEEADLIRNFILMDKEPSVQERFYNDFWHPIEKNTDYHVGEFIRDYLTYSSGKTPRKDKVYAEFKAFVQERCSTDEIELESLLQELVVFSKFYHHFIFFDTDNGTINTILKQISRLQVGVAYPFLLDVFHAWSEKLIAVGDVGKILSFVEGFAFRRLICSAPTNSLNKIFANLGKRIRKENSQQTEYFEIFKYLLSAGTSNSRYPNDTEFRSELMKRDMYNLKPKNRIHLYERLENYKNREKVDVESMIEAKKEGLTFEHIMPQTLTSKWKDELGENYPEILDKYLHTLGNITLTAYNSELANKPFLEKLNKTNGFIKSKLWLNQNLRNHTTWGEDQIKERATLLSDRAVEIWAFPQSEFKPAEKMASQQGIYDDYNFTGTKPKNFVFIEELIPVGSWREVYQKTAKTLYDLDPVTFEKLISDPDGKMATNPKALRDPWKMVDNIYLEVNLSTDGIVGQLKYLLEAFGMEETDFSVTLR